MTSKKKIDPPGYIYMSENRNGLIIGVLAILLVVIFMIPITNMLIDPDTPDPLETPIFELNNHTLREVFESTTPALTNLVPNGDFAIDSNSDGLADNWLVNTDAVPSFSNGLQTIIFNARAFGTGHGRFYQNNVYVANSIMYYVFRAKRNNDIGSNTIGISNGDLVDPKPYILNTEYTIYKDVFTPKTSGGYMLISVFDDRSIGLSVTFDYFMAFNLTDLYGVTETSGTAYDNAVAKIEWLLSKNDGYIQSVGNPFEIVDLTVEEMEYWFSLYQYYLSL